MYGQDISWICPRYVPEILQMSQICPRYVRDMSEICLLPRERWDDWGIFKRQSKLGVSTALQTTDRQSIHANIEPFQNFSINCWTLGSLKFGHSTTQHPSRMTLHQFYWVCAIQGCEVFSVCAQTFWICNQVKV